MNEQADKLLSETKENMRNVINHEKQHFSDASSQVSEAAENIGKHTKVLADEIYDEIKHKLENVQTNLLQCSDAIVKAAKENTLASLLIAGSVGFIVSKVFSKS